MIKIINEVNFDKWEEENDFGEFWEDEVGIGNAVKELVARYTDVENPEIKKDYDYDGVSTVMIPPGGCEYYIANEIDTFDDVLDCMCQNEDICPYEFETSNNEELRQIALDDSACVEDKEEAILDTIVEIIDSGDEEIKKMLRDDWEEIWYGWFCTYGYECFYTDPSGERWYVREC